VIAERGRHEEAIEWYAIGIRAYEEAARLEQAHADPLPRFDPQQGAVPYRAELAVALEGLGRSLLANGQVAPAEKAFRRGLSELDARPIALSDISGLIRPWQKSYRPPMSRTELRSSISFDLARLYEDQGRHSEANALILASVSAYSDTTVAGERGGAGQLGAIKRAVGFFESHKQDEDAEDVLRRLIAQKRADYNYQVSWYRDNPAWSDRLRNLADDRPVVSSEVAGEYAEALELYAEFLDRHDRSDQAQGYRTQAADVRSVRRDPPS